MTPKQPDVPPTLSGYGALAHLYAQGALHRTAFSALPDAPVQPYVEPRRRLRRALAALAGAPRRVPALAITGRRAECSPS